MDEILFFELLLLMDDDIEYGDDEAQLVVDDVDDELQTQPQPELVVNEVIDDCIHYILIVLDDEEELDEIDEMQIEMLEWVG